MMRNWLLACVLMLGVTACKHDPSSLQPRCQANADCAAGQICSRAGACLTLCQKTSECPTGFACDPVGVCGPLQYPIVESPAPDTAITLSPGSYSKNRNATFEFEGSGANEIKGFECRLDYGSFTACESGVTYADLKEGTHTFEVRAVDSARKHDETPASLMWKVDVTAPVVRIDEKPALDSNVPASTFRFSASDASPVTFECKIDASAWLPCVSPAVYSALSEGPHTFAVRATDAVGLPSASNPQWSWTIDTTLPVALIKKQTTTNSNGRVTLRLELGCSEVDDSCMFVCQLDTKKDVCPKDATWSDLEFGNHVLLVWAQDRAGNLSLVPTRRELVLQRSWQEIAAGSKHTCGITNEGSLWCWGDNAKGQLGTSKSTTTSVEPLQVQKGTAWTHVSTGATHTCAIQQGGSLWCWGEAANGRLGLGAGNTDVESPQRVDAGPWRAVASGSVHTCAIRADNNTLWCWGDKTNGRLGSLPTNSTVPSKVDDSTWTHVAVGSDHTCGIRTSGSLLCFGANDRQQSGPHQALPPDAPAGTPSYVATPTLVATPSRTGDTKWKQLALGAKHSCGLDTNDKLLCWGDNLEGQLGLRDPSLLFAIPDPRQVQADTWITVASGAYHSCAIRSDKTLWCWGKNDARQLGSGTGGLLQSRPLQVGSKTTWRSDVALGGAHSCALSGDDDLWCWGDNTTKQLGAAIGLTTQVPMLQVLP